MDKFTKIPNEMLEALYEMNLSKTQYKAVLYIIRKILGWNKKSDHISISKMAEDVGIQRRAMVRAVQGLEAKGIIRIERSSGHTGKVVLLPVTKQTHVTKSTCDKSDTGGVTKQTQVPVTKETHTKDIYKDISKDNYQKTAPYGGDNPWDDVITDEEAEAWANT